MSSFVNIYRTVLIEAGRNYSIAPILARFASSDCQRLASRCLFCGCRIHTSKCRLLKNISSNVRKMSAFAGNQNFIFRQLLDYKSFTYTYLLGDKSTNEAVIIDPVMEMVDRDCQIVTSLGLNLLYAVNTHVHADHITGSGEIKKRLPNCKSMIAEAGGAVADVKLKEGDLIKFGKHQLECRSTPGHTSGCMTFVWHDEGMVFTGDAVLIRGCGRTDFQQGDSGLLYESVHKKILSLPDNYCVFPAHDYTGQTMSTIAEEKQYNPRLMQSKENFIQVMKDLNLPYPKQIDRALPANLLCGVFETSAS